MPAAVSRPGRGREQGDEGEGRILLARRDRKQLGVARGPRGADEHARPAGKHHVRLAIGHAGEGIAEIRVGGDRKSSGVSTFHVLHAGQPGKVVTAAEFACGIPPEDPAERRGVDRRSARQLAAISRESRPAGELPQGQQKLIARQ
jgi:hypothetical protein